MEVSKAACGLPRVSGSSRCESCTTRHRAFCAALEPDEIDALERVVEFSELGPNRTVFYEGDPAENIYNVYSGTVKTFKLLQDGRRQVLGFHGEGELLGLATTPDYAYGAESLTPVAFCRLSRKGMKSLGARFPALESKLLEMTTNELAKSQSQLIVLGRKSAPERIATFLVQLSDKAEAAGGTPNPLTLTMSRHDIADYLGLTAETVSRVLTRFTRDGLISIPQPYQVNFEKIDEIRRLAEIEKPANG